MVSTVKDIKDIKWFEKNEPLLEKELIKLDSIPFKLPQKFNELLLISNGGDIDYIFNYNDAYSNKTLIGSISILYGVGIDKPDYNLINEFYDSPEFFPENIVAFGENGGGNRICFDYRQDPKTDNPPIVYWRMSAAAGEDVSFLANNFDEFLKMLREPEEEQG